MNKRTTLQRIRNRTNGFADKNTNINGSCRCLSSKTAHSCTTSSTSSSSSDSSTHMLIPGQLGFQSAHALINRERVCRNRSSLQRSTYLDQICVMQARHMAQEGALSYTAETMDDLRQLLGSLHVAENIQRGPSVREMHLDSMKDRHRSAYKNILNRRFVEFGVGTTRGVHDDKLYMVQLFRGPTLVTAEGEEEAAAEN
ncbi:hypothetical protein ACA910_016454 [Epithemia clementina (nom. ined.)]